MGKAPLIARSNNKVEQPHDIAFARESVYESTIGSACNIYNWMDSAGYCASTLNTLIKTTILMVESFTSDENKHFVA